jgi:exodeoxyribonuclease VII small subunit
MIGRMAKTSKPPNEPETTGQDLPFEEVLQKLESLLEAMEAGGLPLEELIQRYEEGSRLHKICQTKLAEAELKIRQLDPGTLDQGDLPQTR